MSSKTSSSKQLHFRAESARRFGALDDYVNEKIKDGFPIFGNFMLSVYLAHYLEFLFKRYCIANVLTDKERNALEGSDTILANYLRNLSLGYNWLKEAKLSMSFEAVDDLNKQSQHDKVLEFEEALAQERQFYDAKQRILESRDGFYHTIPQITLMDVGPAIGAVSTLFALKVLDNYGLLEKTCITLVDVSEEVLRRNLNLDFPDPAQELVTSYFGSIGYYEKLKQYLRSATPIHTAVDEALLLGEDMIDITLASFLFHHIPNEAKKAAADNILRATRGAILVADEYFDDYEQEFASRHVEDKITLAPEEPVSFIESLRMFPDANFREAENMQKQFYAYWVLKHKTSYYDALFKKPWTVNV